jgi:hypothetical protein
MSKANIMSDSRAYAGPVGRVAAFSAHPDVWRTAACGAAFFLRSIASITAIVGGDMRKAVIFHAIWTSNVRHITNSDDNMRFGSLGSPPPDALLRPISVLAISQAMRMPYETVRRHVERLTKEGLCQRTTANGVKIDPAFLNQQPERLEVVRKNLISLVSFLKDLKRSGFELSQYRIPRDGVPVSNVTDASMANGRAMMRVCSEFILRTIDSWGRLHGDDLVTSFVQMTIWVHNVEAHYQIAEPTMGRAAVELADEDRRPLSVRAMADAIGLPLETTRRHANNLVWRGAAVRFRDGGLIVPSAVLALPQYQEAARRLCMDIGRTVGDLYRTGLNIDGICD